ncbi:4-hydroxy-tetrahydrodipicolinate reductase [Pantoea sp. Mhis]|uniref:4-hydroxy-tetrahydrodipicolinate reductase n=1 Tax=Pantoea sp. Mhis TaxID=2576759 RepID=UPI001359DF05|nr:4-hydroxy-tetrahydrodipicolinate reductase [Pantoea sp. Mhis]MXP56473.1 4-hydroxy-tetrahydrodipicolinate reductase [Pantoea sp. Mhis]
MTYIRIAIVDAFGRMGKYLIQAVQQTKGVLLGTVLTHRKLSKLDLDAGDLVGIGKIGVIVNNNLEEVIDKFDVLIDFTRPEGTLKYLDFCCKHNKAMVIGTTGLNDKACEIIYAASKEIAIVFSSNFSVGITLMLNLIKQTTKSLGSYTDIDIIEAHHRHKIDAPSGTALTIGNVIANCMNWKLEDHIIHNDARTTKERKPHSISFSSIRAGDIIGEHTVMFTDIGERIEISHKTSSRFIFANGAIKAAQWLNKKNVGLYNMFDVLDL